MKLLECILTDNDCYKTKRTINPQGVMVHSTGADNPMLRRYVQPVGGTPGREDLLAAKADPERYRSLTVRVAGYTAYFTELAGELQDEIIARTSYGDI